MKLFINIILSRASILKICLCDLYYWRGSAPRIGEIIWISPKDIKGFADISKGYGFGDKGSVLPGDWDLNIRPLEKKERVNVLLKMYQKGKNSDAEQELIDLLVRHGWTGEQCELKIKRAWKIFESIRKKGFIVKRQGFIRSLIENKSSVRVAITRNGEFVWLGSNHRMAAALALNLEKMPVTVIWRHLEWQKLRYGIWKQFKNGKIDAESVSHPDLRAVINKSSNKI